MQRERIRCAQAAVHGLRALANKEIREKLDAATRHLERPAPDVLMTHTQEYLSSFSENFYTSCFIDLFPRGDRRRRRTDEMRSEEQDELGRMNRETVE